MEKLIINEKNNVHDNASLKFTGILTFEDENGNILFSANNLIVKTGREFIAKACNGVNFNLTKAKAFIGFDPDKNPVLADTTYDSKLFKSTTIIGTPVFDSTNLTFTFNLEITQDNLDVESKKVNFIALCIGENNVLFSKSLFNTILISPNRIIKVKYVIYF